MAVYKIFPIQDATIYSLFPSMNTGLDPQLEASTTAFAYSDPNPQVSRYLVKFSNEDLTEVLDNVINDNVNNWEAYLRVYSSIVTGMSLNTSIDVHMLAYDWNMGTGQYLDSPITTNGASWKYYQYSGSGPWVPSNGIFPTVSGATITGSWSGSNLGGGAWVFSPASNSTLPVSKSLTFGFRSDKDINLDVTSLVTHWAGKPSASISADFPNYGFLVKQSSTQEFVNSSDVQVEMKYFAVDTHTIYPPQLEFRWRDFKTVLTGSLTGSIINVTPFKLSLGTSNTNFFEQNSVNRFRVYCRPEFPTRNFSTSSYYTTNSFLPTASYYAVKDLDTNEFVINFDTQYTQISADVSSSYFDVYMSGLEPERYYKILVSCSLDGSQYILDDNYYFKVING
jgi:hypothetical protein